MIMSSLQMVKSIQSCLLQSFYSTHIMLTPFSLSLYIYFSSKCVNRKHSSRLHLKKLIIRISTCVFSGIFTLISSFTPICGSNTRLRQYSDTNLLFLSLISAKTIDVAVLFSIRHPAFLVCCLSLLYCIYYLIPSGHFTTLLLIFTTSLSLRFISFLLLSKPHTFLPTPVSSLPPPHLHLEAFIYHVARIAFGHTKHCFVG